MPYLKDDNANLLIFLFFAWRIGLWLSARRRAKRQRVSMCGTSLGSNEQQCCVYTFLLWQRERARANNPHRTKDLVDVVGKGTHGSKGNSSFLLCSYVYFSVLFRIQASPLALSLLTSLSPTHGVLIQHLRWSRAKLKTRTAIRLQCIQ